MKLFALLRSMYVAVVHRTRVDGEMDEELRSHVAHRATQLDPITALRSE